MLGGIVMADAKVSSKPVHDLVLNSRERLSINGIKEIISFDESSVNLKTVNGDLSVDGENIHITVLNVEKGDVELIGKINALTYYDSLEYEKSSIFSRLFK
jgi:sporulation protein YabP